MNSFFFSLAMVCTASPTADTGTSTIRSTCSVSYQRRAMPAPISGLSWWSPTITRDRLAQHRAAEIVHRHLRGGHRALAGRRRRRAVHVGEHADLDHVVRDLGQRRRRRTAPRRRALQARIVSWRTSVLLPLPSGHLAVLFDRELNPSGRSRSCNYSAVVVNAANEGRSMRVLREAGSMSCPETEGEVT